jgi:hypothetical protein
MPLYDAANWLYACFVTPGYLTESIIDGAFNVACNYAIVAALFFSAFLIERTIVGWSRLTSAVRSMIRARKAARS